MKTNEPPRRSLEGPLLALAAALTVFAIGKWVPASPPAPATAHAGLVSSVGDSTLITYSAGTGEDILTVLDQRSETILVYRATPRRDVELLQVVPVQELFDQARAAGPANRR